MQVIVSAPGKIHLMGEHSVVYGKPALLSAINRRTYVSIEQRESMDIETTEDKSFIRAAIDIFQKTYAIDHLVPFRIKITSQLPVGYHLGSSAAVAVATIGALHVFFNKGWNVTKINELAYEVEKTRYPASGADNTVATIGGFLWYRKEFEFLKSMWQLPFRISSKLNPFVLVSSGTSIDSTVDMVALVKEKHIKQKEITERLFNDQEETTKSITVALKDGDEEALLDCIRHGERNLEALGVVGKKAHRIIRIVETHGGAAKILGGGGIREGSGMLLVYHPDTATLAKLIKQEQWEILQIVLGEEGIRQELYE